MPVAKVLSTLTELRSTGQSPPCLAARVQPVAIDPRPTVAESLMEVLDVKSSDCGVAGQGETIQKYLGDNYEVVASMGHIRDLPKSNKIGGGYRTRFHPNMLNIKGKRKI